MFYIHFKYYLNNYSSVRKIIFIMTNKGKKLHALQLASSQKNF